MNRPVPIARRRRQQGFSIVEILVTVVVLTIGMLGHAGLQARGQRSAGDAQMRFELSNQAREILDRMRANRISALNGDYNISIGATISGTSLATQDLQNWKAALRSVNDAADGSIAVAGTLTTVTITWTNSQNQADTVLLRTEL